MPSLAQDLRFASRMLRRNPGFTIVAVLTLALGLGANTAIFSVVRGVLLRALPYRDADRVVRIAGRDIRAGVDEMGTMSLPDVMDIRDQSTVFEDISLLDEWTPVITGAGEPERLAGASVSSGYFGILGVEPAFGRFFVREEDTPGHEPVVVLAHSLWQRRFGGDRSVIGRPLRLNQVAYTIIGVLPEGFEDPHLEGRSFRAPQLWRVTPAYFNPKDMCRSCRSLTAVGRLKPGVPVARANAEVEAIMTRVAEAHPEDSKTIRAYLIPLKDWLVAPVRPALMVLLGVVGLVLLIACANVANLLLSRAASRQREIALRTALGASRRRLLTQLLTESALLAVVGGALGAALAWAGVRGLLVLGSGSIPRAEVIHIDGAVLLFTTLATVATGVLFGLVPALHATRVDLQGALKDGGRGVTMGAKAHHTRATLVVVEVALSLVLLVGAGLLIKSFWRLQQVDTGIRAEQVLTFELAPASTAWPDSGGVDAFWGQILPKLAALPGVTASGTVNYLPMTGSFSCDGFTRDDQPPPPPGEGACTETRAATPGYFRTLGIRVVRGRALTEQDTRQAPQVAVINETMAAKFFPGEDPIGKRVTTHDVSREIVGIVADVRDFGAQASPSAMLYATHAQESASWARRSMVVTLRTANDPLALAAAVRPVVRSMDPSVPITDLRTMESVVSKTVAQPRFRTLLLALFATVALVLAAVGIAAVMAYNVTQRTHEIGVRMALGAQSADVLRLVIAQGMRPTLLGVAIGVALSLAATRLLAGFLFGVGATDATTFLGVALLLSSVALGASWVPAWRASRVDPMVALRSE